MTAEAAISENSDVSTPYPNRWKPGVSGNIAGKPRGSRTKLAEMFWRDLHDEWKASGKAAIKAMITDRPGDFVKVVASQMPKEFLVSSSDVGDMSNAELGDIIATLRAWVGTVGVDSARARIIEAARDGEAGE